MLYLVLNTEFNKVSYFGLIGKTFETPPSYCGVATISDQTSESLYKWLVRDLYGKYGAPMGRTDYGKPNDKIGRVFDRKVPLNNGGYDRGGAYWGLGETLRVRYTLDLKYIRWYRGAKCRPFPKEKP